MAFKNRVLERKMPPMRTRLLKPTIQVTSYVNPGDRPLDCKSQVTPEQASTDDAEQRVLNSRIKEMFVHTLGGDPIPPAAVQWAESLLTASAVRQPLKILGILAKAGTPRQKATAWSQLREIAVTSDSLSTESYSDLLVILMQCGRDIHIADGAFKDFVHKAATDGRSHIRSNAMVVLEQFARHGDVDAITLLNQGKNDGDPRVSGNAKSVLARLSRIQKVLGATQ